MGGGHLESMLIMASGQGTNTLRIPSASCRRRMFLEPIVEGMFLEFITNNGMMGQSRWIRLGIFRK